MPTLQKYPTATAVCIILYKIGLVAGTGAEYAFLSARCPLIRCGSEAAFRSFIRAASTLFAVFSQPVRVQALLLFLLRLLFHALDHLPLDEAVTSHIFQVVLRQSLICVCPI